MESDDSEIYADVPSNAAVNSTKQCYSWYDRTKGMDLFNYALILPSAITAT